MLLPDRQVVLVSGAPGAGKTSLAEIAARRFAERAVRSRHPVHVITSLTTDEMAEYDRPVGIGELITVDTSVPVDVRALGRQVRALLAAPA